MSNLKKKSEGLKILSIYKNKSLEKIGRKFYKRIGITSDKRGREFENRFFISLYNLIEDVAAKNKTRDMRKGRERASIEMTLQRVI